MTHVTVPATLPLITYPVTTAQTVFTIPAYIVFWSEDDLRVAIDGVDLADTGWSVVGVDGGGGYTGGTLTLAVAVSNCELALYRSTELGRSTDFVEGAPITRAELNTQFDKMAAQIVDAYWRNDRALRVPSYAAGMSALDIAAHPGESVIVNGAGDGFATAPSTFSGALASAITYTPAWTNAVARTVAARLQDALHIEDFGAVGDDATDCTAAFTAALLTGKPVIVGAGIYRISSAIAIIASKSGIIGQGRELSEIKIVSTTAKAITIADGLTRVILKGLRVTRSGVPVSGANGIDCSAAVLGTSTFEDLWCEGHYIGVSLGVTDYSFVNQVMSQKNYGDGFRIANVGTNGQCQWNLHQCFAQFNDGAGYIVKSGVQTGQITLGNWDSCGTYANTGKGMSFEGTATMPVQGVRLNNCYVGDDNGGAGIYLDTYGTLHRIVGTFVELVGQGASGRLFGTGGQTAASATGPGIWATANNNALTVTDTRIDSCAYDGIQSGARAFNANGCDITDNGLALTANRRNGIKLIAGTSYASIMGGTNGARLAGTSQQYAVEAFAAAGTTIMGVAAMNLSAGLVAGALPNVIGNTIAGHFFISDGVCIGVPTGGSKGAGTLNSAGDQYKNNTAFTNP